MTISIDWQKIIKEIKPVDDQDAITAKEFAEVIGMGGEPAYRRLKKLVDEGLAIETTKISNGRYVKAWAVKK